MKNQAETSYVNHIFLEGQCFRKYNIFEESDGCCCADACFCIPFQDPGSGKFGFFDKLGIAQTRCTIRCNFLNAMM